MACAEILRHVSLSVYSHTTAAASDRSDVWSRVGDLLRKVTPREAFLALSAPLLRTVAAETGGYFIDNDGDAVGTVDDFDAPVLVWAFRDESNSAHGLLNALGHGIGFADDMLCILQGCLSYELNLASTHHARPQQVLAMARTALERIKCGSMRAYSIFRPHIELLAKNYGEYVDTFNLLVLHIGGEVLFSELLLTPSMLLVPLLPDFIARHAPVDFLLNEKAAVLPNRRYVGGHREVMPLYLALVMARSVHAARMVRKVVDSKRLAIRANNHEQDDDGMTRMMFRAVRDIAACNNDRSGMALLDEEILEALAIAPEMSFLLVNHPHLSSSQKEMMARRVMFLEQKQMCDAVEALGDISSSSDNNIESTETPLALLVLHVAAQQSTLEAKRFEHED